MVKSGEMNAADPDRTFEFGDFSLNARRRRLSQHGAEVPLTAKPFDALVLLVARAGETVSRAELAQALWPTVVVEDNNLSQTILAVRRALGDTEGAPRFVLTVPRQGYRFIASVTARSAGDEAPDPRLADKRLSDAGPRASKRAIATILVAVSIFLAAGAWVALRNARPPATPATPSTALAEPRTSPEAHAAYLRALSLYQTQGGIGVSLSPATRQAMRAQIESSLRADPRYPPALGWQAHLALDRWLFDPVPPAEWPARSAELLGAAERDARAALAADPTLGIAHTTLARLHMVRGRLDQARDALASALTSSPDDAMVLHYEAMVRTLRDEHQLAIAAARRAIALEPRNPAPWGPLAFSLAALGDAPGAADAARRQIATAPTAAIGYVMLARLQVGGDADALREARRAVTMAEQFLGTLGNFRIDVAILQARLGERAAAARLVQQFHAQAGERHLDPGLEAMAHMAVGEYDAAKARVEQAVRERREGADAMTLLLIRRNAWSDPVLETPRWRELRAALAAAEIR